MSIPSNPRITNGLAALTVWTSIGAIGAAGVGLLIWQLQSPALRGPGALNPPTAAAFILAALSLRLNLPVAPGRSRGRRTLALAFASAGGAAALGALGLGGFLFDRTIGIGAAQADQAGRMSALTALCFVLLGGALILSQSRPRAATVLAAVTSAIAIFALVGYLYNVEAPAYLSPAVNIAPLAAVLLISLAGGVFAIRPDQGLAQIWVSDTVVGSTVRRLLPAVVGVPFLIGWLGLAGERAKVFGDNSGVMVAASSSIVVMTVLITWIAQNLIQTELGRRRTETALRVSETRLRSLYENMHEGYAYCRMIYDGEAPQDFVYLAVNEAFERLTGRENLVGKKVSDVIPGIKESNPELFEIYGRVAASGRPERFDTYLAALSMWLSISVYSPETGFFIAIFENVTERKQADEALRENEHKYRSVVEQAADGISLTDEAGRVVEFNRATEQITGINRDEAIGRLQWDVLFQMILPERQSAERYAELKEDILQALATGQAAFIDQDVVGDIQRPDGARRSIQQRVFAIRTERGWRLGSITRDITDKVKAEATQRQHSAALAAAANGIVITDRNGAIEWVNPAFSALTGFSLAEVIGRNPRELVKSGLHDPAFYKAMWDTIVGGNVWRGELINRRKDGGLYSEEQTITPLRDESGEISHFIGVKQDISERKRTEARIQRQLKQLTALRTIDQAITGSFDLRVTSSILLEETLSQLGVDGADLLVFQAGANMLEYVAGRGFLSTALQHTRLRLGEGYAGRAAQERRSVHIANIMQAGGDLARALALAQETFVSYYGIPLIAKGQVKGVLEIFHRGALELEDEWLGFLETLAGQAAIAIDDSQLLEGLYRSNMELALAYDVTLEGWSRALDLRDKETEGHSQRVTEMTIRTARAMDLGDAELTHIRRGALLHDVGKLGIPDSILLKTGPLTEAEWAVMRRHPGYAYEWLSPIAFLQPALDIPYCHHEKWDGTGYPRGLKGEQIPLAARIFAIVDVWDALRSDRPYRPRWPEDQVRAYLEEQSGRHFDPQVARAFLTILRSVEL